MRNRKPARQMSEDCQKVNISPSDRICACPYPVLKRAKKGAVVQVLHVINGEHYSGAERVQDLLALTLPEEGIEAGFACVKPLRFPKERRSQTPLFETPMRSKFDLRAAQSIANIVRTDGYHLIHAHTPRAALVGRIASRLARVPMVYHVHSPARFDTADRLRNQINVFTERWCIHRIPAAIAVSETLKAHMEREKFPTHRIHVVPNGVPSPAALPAWNPPQNRPWVIGMIALFRPRKGLEVLLDALLALRNRGVATKLLAVGPFESADYEAGIRQKIAACGLADSIEWVGYTQDVAAQLARMDILALPSLYGEGLPMVVLEAMAAGVPVVASHVEGTAEALRHGTDGLLVEAGSPEMLAQAMRAIIEGHHPAQTLRQNAYARQCALFSDKHMARGVAEVYRMVLAA